MRSCSPCPAPRAEARAAGHHHMEIKSGYGLTVESEERLCALAAELTDDVTFLGAHLVPAEYEGRADEYVDLVCGEMLEACAPHCRWIDVFCEPAPSTPTNRGPCWRPGGAPGSGCASTATSSAPARGAGRGRDWARLGRSLHLPDRRRRRRARRQRRPSPPSSRRPTSRPASPIPTRAARSTPASRSRSRPTATPARATRPRCRSASRSPCARWG